MMLQALVALAERKGLLDDTSVGPRRVHFQLRIDSQGKALGLVPLGEDGKGLELVVPVPPKRSGGFYPAFVVDNAQYVLGLPKRAKGKELTPELAARGRECLTAYRRDIAEAAQVTGDVGLAALVVLADRVLEAGAAEITALAPDHEWTGDECVAPMLDEDGALYIHARPPVRAYWAQKRGAQTSGEAHRCLVTGTLAPVARLHDVLKRVPEAQPSGASLVSFDKAAFTSQGLDRGANAPVSQRAVDGYVRALNWMLAPEGERRFRSGVLVGDSVVLFWSRDEDATADVLLSLFAPQGDSEAMRSTFEAALRGLAPSDIDASRFYAATLTGNAARVVVRDWLETTAGEVKANVRRYFDDLALSGDDTPLSISRLLHALEAAPSARGDKRGLSPVLATRLFRAAIHGEPFPRELLHAALARLRVPPREREGRWVLRARVALVKATLNRLPNRRLQEVSVSLDSDNRSIPYLLGRLFAVLERLQGVALGDINASIRDKYFGAASATPTVVFPRLLRGSVHHAAKAAEKGRWLERTKGQIIAALPAAPLPRTLDLEEQGLFAVGYYHQRESFFAPREGGEEASEAGEAEPASSPTSSASRASA